METSSIGMKQKQFVSNWIKRNFHKGKTYAVKSMFLRSMPARYWLVYHSSQSQETEAQKKPTLTRKEKEGFLRETSPNLVEFTYSDGFSPYSDNFSLPLSEQLAVFHVTDILEACFFEFFRFFQRLQLQRDTRRSQSLWVECTLGCFGCFDVLASSSRAADPRFELGKTRIILKVWENQEKAFLHIIDILCRVMIVRIWQTEH